MGKPIEQSGCQLGAINDTVLLRVTEFYGDSNPGTLIELAQQMKQKFPTGQPKGCIAKIIGDHQVCVH